MDKHTLHGGSSNIAIQQFSFEIICDNKVKFSHIRKSTDDGFPGNLNIAVTYELLENSVIIHYDAISDKDTILNITCLVWGGCPNNFISFSPKHIRRFIKNLRFNSIPF